MYRGEITYYEELGVAPDASAGEIHAAFRALVKLLHPDQQRDPELRAIAERQMRKLNHIHSLLSDPERRRQYDQHLTSAHAEAGIAISQVRVRRMAASLTWAGAIVLGVMGLIWLATESPAARVPNLPEHATASSAGESPIANMMEMGRLKAELRRTTAERDEAWREVARLRSAGATRRAPLEATDAPLAAAPIPTETTPTAAPVVNMPPPSAAPVPPAPVIAAVTAPARLAPVSRAVHTGQGFEGFWFFMKPPQSAKKSPDLYPPEFIEATITEQSGIVHGRYRSRYRIGDRAISPDVDFEFSGAPAGGSLVCAWKGMGGARGELTLHILPEGTMKVDWKALELGSTQALVAGTATLTRQIE